MQPLLVASILLLAGTATASAQEQVIWSFQHNGTDGYSPNGGLTIDKSGNLYGVTSQGGANSSGIAYELSPPAQAGGDWTETILYNFGDVAAAGGAAGGTGEGATVIFDTAGNLYGTAPGGTSPGNGQNPTGVVYELSPPQSGSGEWGAQALYTFVSESSQPTLLNGPNGGLVFDKSANLYGIATTGGAHSVGGVFELTPPSTSGGAWTMTPIYSFNNTIGAGQPWGPSANAGLIVDAKGNLYGTTEYGGVNGLGTVYELSPPAAGGNGTWTATVLYSFNTSSIFDAKQPAGSLIFDATGNLYGTSTRGGTDSGGAVFELTPPASAGGKWTETVLYSFNPNVTTDGNAPYGNLLFDQQGNLWGATFHGGPYYADNISALSYGAIFELIPQGGGKWAEASPMPYFFGAQSTDAINPNQPIVMDGKGNLYSPSAGGANACNSSTQCGAVWEYTPPAPAATPTFNPPAGKYTSAQSVQISDSISGAMIFYTTDGSTPNTSSTEYSSAVPVKQSETLQAIAVATGFAQSAVASAIYVIETPAATPVISPKAGTYGAAFPVTITDATHGATIYYTTNGAPPTISSTKYAGAFKVTADETVRAIATAPNFTPSAIGSAAYSVKAATPVISVKAGTYAKAQSVKITDTTAGATIYFTTNGAPPTAASKKYAGAITVSENETVKAIAAGPKYAESALAEAAYMIETAPPTISPDGGTFGKAQTVTLKDATAGAIIFYTTNGATPSKASTKYTKALTVSAKETVKAIAIAPDHASSTVTAAVFTVK